jgi:hypothetical protein
MAEKQDAAKLVDRAQEHLMRGEDAECIPLALQGLDIYSGMHDIDGVGRVCNLLGVAMTNAGDLPKAFEYYQRALASIAGAYRVMDDRERALATCWNPSARSTRI